MLSLRVAKHKLMASWLATRRRTLLKRSSSLSCTLPLLDLLASDWISGSCQMGCCRMGLNDSSASDDLVWFLIRRTQEGCSGLGEENPGASPKAGPMFQQPLSSPESAQTLAGIAFRAAGKLGTNFPAASTFARRPLQQGISDNHSLLNFSDCKRNNPLASVEKSCFLLTFVALYVMHRSVTPRSLVWQGSLAKGE